MKRSASSCVLTLALLVALPLAAAGCASKDATDKQLAEMRETVTKLRADHLALLERLEAIEAARAHQGLRGQDGGNPDLAVVKLAPPAADASEDPDDPTARTVIRAKGYAISVEDKGRSLGPDKDYEAAMDLYKQHRTEKALEAFALFLSRYPESPRAEAITFARGDAFAGKGDHRRAIEQYESVATRWPAGEKAPDALLRAAQSYTRMGDKNDADEVRKRLAATYPTSEAAKKLAPIPGANR